MDQHSQKAIYSVTTCIRKTLHSMDRECGLNGNSIYNITTDRKGKLWFSPGKTSRYSLLKNKHSVRCAHRLLTSTWKTSFACTKIATTASTSEDKTATCLSEQTLSRTRKKKKVFAASYRRHGKLPNKTYIFCYNDLETPSFCTRSHATHFHVHAPAQPEYPLCVPACRSPTKSGTSFRKDRTASTLSQLSKGDQQPRNQIYGCQRTLE